VRGWQGDGDSRLAARRSRRLYLTFDDGPDERWTPLVLDELAREGVRATFFVVGEHALRHPELIARLSEEGHEVELHCMHHRRHTLQTREEVEADTREALTVLERSDVRPRRWRPPYAIAEWWTAEIAEAHGLRLTGGSCDPRDWAEEGVPAALEAARPDLAAGNVVVMHDGRELGGSREDTVGLIAPLVAEARERGLEPGPLGEGPAFWWQAMTDRPDPRLRFEIVDEGQLGEEDAAQIRSLLAENITREQAAYAERGYRLVPPLFRALARKGTRVVGHVSMGALRSDPALGLMGLMDGAVADAFRQRGVGAALMSAAFAEARARGAGGVLADTTAFATWARRHAFYRPTPLELTALRPGNFWLYRPAEAEPTPFFLIDDDF
jgi:GNAT superfamily N-acetyltransferase